MLKIYMGYDEREPDAYSVAARSILVRASDPKPLITPLKLSVLEDQGLMYRPRRVDGGQTIDVISDAPQSTQFAISRFLTHILAQTGWALFMDCDMLARTDLNELLKLADPRKAVMVVKHNQNVVEDFKMDNRVQTRYARKNWSSVMLFNCDHASNRMLNLKLVNEVPGRNLHGFCWLEDEEIGELPREWNWLIGVQPRPDKVKIAHFTLGGPWFENWKGGEYDDEWIEEARSIGLPYMREASKIRT